MCVKQYGSFNSCNKVLVLLLAFWRFGVSRARVSIKRAFLSVYGSFDEELNSLTINRGLFYKLIELMCVK